MTEHRLYRLEKEILNKFAIGLSEKFTLYGRKRVILGKFALGLYNRFSANKVQ